MATTATTEEVWTAFRDKLYRYIRSRSRSSADAEDILQNVFVKVHRHIGTLADDVRLAAWLYRVTHNEIIDHYRKKHPTPIPTVEPAPADEHDPDAEQQLAPFLDDLIADLPPKYRDALTLTEIQGVTQREMSRRLGLSVSGAKSRVQRGRALLRDHLLDCCTVELDCRGRVIDYASRTGEIWTEDCPCRPKDS